MRMLGSVPAVVERVLARPELFAALMPGLHHHDPRVQMRAADAIEKLTREHPAWLKPHKRQLLQLAASATRQELRWHLAQLLPRLSLTSAERRRAAATLKSYLDDKSSIVRTTAMQALFDLASVDRSLNDEIAPLLVSLTRTGTPAMRARGRKLLEQLAKSRDSRAASNSRSQTGDTKSKI
jgi:hypothetical protein